jgi:hypothetical protein
VPTQCNASFLAESRQGFEDGSSPRPPQNAQDMAPLRQEAAAALPGRLETVENLIEAEVALAKADLACRVAIVEPPGLIGKP